MTDYAGLDYGMGKANIDHESGIRYGVISQNDVGEAWFEDSRPYYVYTCEKCNMEFKNDLPEKCQCGHEFEDGEFDILEPITFFVDDGAYQAECGEDGDIFITKSPYFTYAQFCSPCAPGAVHLGNPFKGSKKEAENAGFARGYCFGHDWFDKEVAPYPVYSVETGELINPK